MIIQQFGMFGDKIRLLDYGGGEGRMMELLRANGFRNVATYDPFSSRHNVSDGQKYDLITAFEVFEHVPDPIAMMRDITSRMMPEALLLFSTLLQPADFGAWVFPGGMLGQEMDTSRSTHKSHSVIF